MTHFSHDYEQGIKDERQRIIDIINAQVEECGEQCDCCMAQLDIIELMKEAE